MLIPRLRNEADYVSHPERPPWRGSLDPALTEHGAAAHAPARAAVRPRNSPDRMCSRPATRDEWQQGALHPAAIAGRENGLDRGM